MPEHGFQQRVVGADQPAIQRILRLVRNPAADPVAHQHRNQRHRETGGRRHGIGFCKRQRAEQASFLRFQREHRNEGQRDDHQREEQRRADLGRRAGHHLPVGFACQRLAGMRMIPRLDFLVRVFDHHHRRIDHGADGNGNATERHDVGVDTLHTHDDEGDQHAQRQRDDRHQRRAQMPQEHSTHQRHHDEFLDQLASQILDRPVD